jgi:hypothetical protein
VPLDRSGIRIEKRFTFYDQVHTTGMDIKQALNATAVVTLGKDMTLRDYSQGCWRMRGLGKGQRIHMMVVKEVSELIRKSAQTMTTHLTTHLTTHPGHEASEARTPLVHAVAWLITNSMRSEMLQDLQLQMQMITNLWRKSAFRTLMKSRSARQQDKYATAMLTTRFHPKIVTEEELKENFDQKKLEEIDIEKNLLFLMTARGVLPPLNAFLGGVVSQEIIKSITHKFMPIRQGFYVDFSDIIPPHIAQIATGKSINDGINTRNVVDYQIPRQFIGLEIILGSQF